MYCKKCGTENDDNAIECINCKMQFKKKSINNKIILLVGVVAIIVLLIPFGISKYTDNIIEQKKIDFQDMGINLNIYSTSGYINTTRKINLQINNGRYLANNIYKFLKNNMPEYKDTLEIFIMPLKFKTVI